MRPNYFDIHSHLNLPQFDSDREDVVARMRNVGVWTTTVGVDYKSSKEAVALAEKYDEFFAVIGQHPSDNHKEIFDLTVYEKLVAHPKVVAVGECGLEYFRVKNSIAEVKKNQTELFEKQIALALAHDKPLMLHCRPSEKSMDAYEDTLEVLVSYAKTHGNKLRGNVHFFVGNTTIAKQFLNLGFTLSFTGVITFARDYDEVVKYVPLDSIMSETDAPFVSPITHRGKRNEPTYVPEVVEYIAQIRGENKELVKKQMVDNALKFFNFTET